jgi:hypothetical protein
VVEALYRGRGVGHEFLRECVAAIMGAVRNQAHPELCVIAVQLLQKCGRRLAERNSPEEGAAEGAAAAELSSAPLSGKLSRQASQTSPYGELLYRVRLAASVLCFCFCVRAAVRVAPRAAVSAMPRACLHGTTDLEGNIPQPCMFQPHA